MPTRSRSPTFEKTRRSWLSRLPVGLIAAFSLSMSAAGCVVHTYPEEELVHGHAVVRVESAPAHIHTYPRVHYHDGYAYLVEDRWYYHGPRGWVVFRSHPRELEAQRVRIIREHRPDRHRPPRYYEERRAPSRAKEPDERGRRYYDD